MKKLRKDSSHKKTVERDIVFFLSVVKCSQSYVKKETSRQEGRGTDPR